MITAPNPPKQTVIAAKLGRSRDYAQRIIKENVCADLMKKRKAMELSPKQAQQPHDRGKIF